ncbi:hypothetical protein KMZ30_07425 [Phycicoccus sp. KQZ13P-1]|uniref:recombination directionality factor n=1 Tax=Phycicoccus mangrovi TaxID=2840470 RepID=UPI001C007AFF|nr:hypothetical protein [Phycicoccus mangrovi]MBT9255402.1 hypothetical protein [Phycicoccus mangrovi]
MPIDPIVLQRRHAEVGRIRLGVQQDTGRKRNGRAVTRPAKLETFRFTSASRELVDAVAAVYGGEVKPWANGNLQQWEVITPANVVPVFVVKNGVTQWMETWSGGGCVHRCDGVRDVEGNLCDPDDPQHREARATTRLSVMLPEIESIGVWRLESHGYNAAAEIPMVAELAQHVGDLVPAVLRVVERVSRSGGETKRFMVPQLDLLVTKDRLREIADTAAGRGPSLELDAAPQMPALPAAPAPQQAPPAAPPAGVPDDVRAAAGATNDPDEIRSLWRSLAGHGRMNEAVAAFLTARLSELTNAQAPDPAEEPALAAVPDEAPAPLEEPVDAEVVEGPDPAAEAAWTNVLMAAGARGWTTEQVTDSFEQWAAVPVGDGDAEMFGRFIAEVLS